MGKRAFLFLLGFVFLPLQAMAASIETIEASPSSFDGKAVEVTGKIAHLREKTSHAGNQYAAFQLCAQSCVKVFLFGIPHIANGQRITVNGTFSAVKRQGPYTFYNEIDTDEESIR